MVDPLIVAPIVASPLVLAFVLSIVLKRPPEKKTPDIVLDGESL